MGGSQRVSGMTAKCAPLKGLVLIVQTDRLFLVSPVIPLMLFILLPLRESVLAPRLSPA